MISKLSIVFLLLLSVSLAQFSTNSVNGFGNNSHIISPSSESMGGMWMYNSNINNWDPLLASSIYKTNLTMIAVSSSFEGVHTNHYKVNSHLINSVNFSFPINKKMGFSIGLSPYSRTGYHIEDSQYNMIGGTEYASPLGSKSSYNIQGGISKLSIALSRASFNEKIALGFKWNILFGNQEINTTTSLAEISYDQMGNQIFTLNEILYNYEFNHFNGYSYDFDSRINTKNSSFSFLISLLDDFEINRNEVSQLFSSNNNYLFDKLQIDELALGYMYNKNNNFGIALEGHFKNNIKYSEEVMILGNSTPSQISIHNGLYKIINNARTDSWNSINLSTGYSYKLIKFNEEDLNDISFSLGMGISFNEKKNNINISFTIGSRESIVETIDRENYYKFNMAILSGDKWFEKRKRD